MNLSGVHVKLHDMSLRDGMHAKRHQITLKQMVDVAVGLDEAGMPLIEVTHGDGLGGASVNYGFPLHTDEEYLKAVIPQMKHAKVSALLIPGIGTVDHARMAAGLGVSTLRVATHCSEADVAEQHIGVSRELGLDTVGFLMMAHMIDGGELALQAKLMESYGAQTVYVTDSAGYMLPHDVTLRIEAVRAALAPETEVGFHGHHNLAMGVANSLAVLERMGAETGINIYKLMAVAEERVVPLMDQPIRLDRESLLLGFAGVYSSFLLHAQRASKRHGVPAEDILLELGRMRTVGGQEDMIEDVALNLAREGRAN